jgi:hypothetical protein
MASPAHERTVELTATNGTTQLEAFVQCRLSGRVRNFRLVRVDRGLILQGRSHTYYAKQLAQHAVLEMTRVPIVANEIEVD